MMKTIFLAASLLVAGTTASLADVSISGDGRMGLFDDGKSAALSDYTGLEFRSRLRVTFTLSGTSDQGLVFGGAFRADQAKFTADPDHATELYGSVFIAGDFGKFSVGSVLGAAEAAVGDLYDVGYTDLIYREEGAFITGDATYTTALYEYTRGNTTLYLSGGNSNDSDAAVGLSLAIAKLRLGLGYEQDTWGPGTLTDIAASVTADFDRLQVKALLVNNDYGHQWGASAVYGVDNLHVTATWVQNSDGVTDLGVGAAYDLGGGLTLAAGYALNEGSPAYDLGLKFKF